MARRRAATKKSGSYNIEDVVKSLQTKYPRSTLARLTEVEDMKISRLPTGDEMMNMLLAGGVPEGRIIEIFGAPGSGKTTVTLRFAEAYTRAGRDVLFIDTEHALNPIYAKRIGVDLDKVMISQPESAEEVFDTIFEMLKVMENGLVIVDSTAAMLPIQELRAEGGGQHGMLLLPRIMARNLTKLVGLTARRNTTVIFISQTRTKISTMPSYGPAKKGATGGNALKFYASLRLRITKIKTLKAKTGEALGQISSCKAVKSKVSRPFGRVEWYINVKTPSDFITSLAINVPQKGISLDKKRKMVQQEEYKEKLMSEIKDRLTNFEEKYEDEEVDWANVEIIDEKLDKEDQEDLKGSAVMEDGDEDEGEFTENDDDEDRPKTEEEKLAEEAPEGPED